jgi:beta-glucosidase
VRKRAPAAAVGDTVLRYTGEITGNARLGIPPLRMNDGPQGFRTGDALAGTSTGWPSALTLAATFDTQLASEWGHAMGQEFRDKGAGMQLGPGVNVARLPECGRNFESVSRPLPRPLPRPLSHRADGMPLAL